MASAVAENTGSAPTESAGSRTGNLGLMSLVGGVAILAAFLLVFGVLPTVWGQLFPKERMNEFLSSALLLIVGIGVLVGVVYALRQLDRAFAVHGLRGGSFLCAFLLFLAAWLSFGVGGAVNQEGPGMFVALAFAGIVFGGLFWWVTRASFGPVAVALEDQGWFHLTPFKGNQGLRVRRATIIGVLSVVITGIIAMVAHGVWGTARSGDTDWYWTVPFTTSEVQDAAAGTKTTTSLIVPLVSRINVMGPLLLGALAFWFVWRLVNWPTFADFLIATEAEMNKVSWTNRKRLVQDTIVVLVTVFLFTFFLFLLDIVWFKVLSNPLVSVLHVNLKAEQQKQQEKTQW